MLRKWTHLFPKLERTLTGGDGLGQKNVLGQVPRCNELYVLLFSLKSKCTN